MSWKRWVRKNELYVLEVVRLAVILMAGIIFAFMSMILAYALPNGKVIEHVRNSMSVFEKEGDYYNLYDGNWGSRLDNFTDIYYLQMCFIEGSDSVIDNALTSYGLRYVSDKLSPTEDMTAYFNGKDSGVYPRETRFWNGYVIFLKPLLYFADYSQIRMINLALQICLMCLVLFLVRKKLGNLYIFPFLLTWISLNPVVVSLNIFYSDILFSTFIPVIFMLLFNEKMKNKNLYKIFFLLVGMETIFFNMNSSLALPVGICMILYYIMNGTDISGIWKKFKRLFSLGMAWLFGAMGMWSANWILNDLLTDNFSVWEAFQIALERTSTGKEGEMTRVLAIKGNWNILWSDSGWKLCIILYTIGILGYILRMVYKKKLSCKISIIADLIWFCIFVSIPFIWYGFMPSHAYMHRHFTYRTLAIGVLAFTSLPVWILCNCSLKKDKLR